VTPCAADARRSRSPSIERRRQVVAEGGLPESLPRRRVARRRAGSSSGREGGGGRAHRSSCSIQHPEKRAHASLRAPRRAELGSSPTTEPSIRRPGRRWSCRRAADRGSEQRPEPPPLAAVPPGLDRLVLTRFGQSDTDRARTRREAVRSVGGAAAPSKPAAITSRGRNRPSPRRPTTGRGADSSTGR
jgi:hypothetical protein